MTRNRMVAGKSQERIQRMCESSAAGGGGCKDTLVTRGESGRTKEFLHQNLFFRGSVIKTGKASCPPGTLPGLSAQVWESEPRGLQGELEQG